MSNYNHRRAQTRHRRLGVEYLESRCLLAIGAELVKDINSVETSGSSVFGGTVVGNNLFFSADDGVHGAELWKSDGSSAGTELVKDIRNGSSSSSPKNLIDLNGVLCFVANDGSHGTELWRSDGTAAGTYLIKDINPEQSHSNPSWLTVVNGELYFTANDGVHNGELWKSDGTAGGTTLVKDIRGGAVSSSPQNLTNVDGNLFFVANDGSNGFELWKSDGTSAGTVLVKDIRAGSSDALPANLTNIGGMLYFSANDGVSGVELWKSNGTPEGTVLIKDLVSGQGGSFPTNFTALGDLVYFIADSELWYTDGTSDGTVLVTGDESLSFSAVDYLLNVDGTLFLQGRGQDAGAELWKSDGTVAGTVLVKDLSAGSSSSDPRSFINFNGTLFFLADTTITNDGYGVWKSDGTADGTARIGDVTLGPFGFPVQMFVVFDGLFYFPGTDRVKGQEMWQSDGTADGTRLLKDINSHTLSSSPSNFVNLDGTLYFIAQTTELHNDLWRTNGTAAGTSLVADASIGAAGFKLLTASGSHLFFVASVSGQDSQLWLSDGTTASTVLVKEFSNGAHGSSISNLTDVNGMLFFAANDGIHGVELWKSDGTANGTTLVKDFASGAASSNPSQLVAVGNLLYLTAAGQIWRTDGTESGTVAVNRADGAPPMTGPSSLIRINDTIYFVAKAISMGIELWMVDLVTNEYVLVKDIREGFADSRPTELTAVGNTLYFVANDGMHGPELWRSDGTANGTHLFKDIRPDASVDPLAPAPKSLFNADGLLYFNEDDGMSGEELWRSDGTAAGTFQLADINRRNSSPSNFTLLEGQFYFTAEDDLSNSRQIWATDGTEAGTQLVTYIEEVSISSPGPTNLFAFGTDLYFSAETEEVGRELWRLAPTKTLVAKLEGGSLWIADSHPYGRANALTALRAGDTLTINDANESFAVIPPGTTLLNDGHTLVVPLSLVSDRIVIDAAAGDNSLTLNANGADLDLQIVDGQSLALSVVAGSVELRDTPSLRSLDISGGAIVTVPAGTNVLETNGLSIDTESAIDLSDNSMIVRATTETRLIVRDQVTGWLATGSSNLAWNGRGIRSSAAAADPGMLTALGVMLNGNGLGGTFYGEFVGVPVNENDVLVKFTYYGDADLSGTINGTDYALIDNGYNARLTNWFDGDFNYSDVIDGTDYVLIDNAFNTQSGLSATITPAPVLTLAAPDDRTVGQTPGFVFEPTRRGNDDRLLEHVLVFDEDPGGLLGRDSKRRRF